MGNILLGNILIESQTFKSYRTTWEEQEEEDNSTMGILFNTSWSLLGTLKGFIVWMACNVLTMHYLNQIQEQYSPL